MSNRSGSGAGWRVRRSIAAELSVAIDFVSQDLSLVPNNLIDLVATMPATWIGELSALGLSSALGDEPRYPLDYLPRWADVLEVEDYDAASAAMREITLGDTITQVAEASGLQPQADLEPTEQLVDLELRVLDQGARDAGFHPSTDAFALEKQRNEVLHAIRVLRGGTLHNRFWYWIDRFYHEAYRPWRNKRLDAIAKLEQRAINGLGKREGSSPPSLGWLPSENVLVAIPTVRTAVEEGRVKVVFWAEPFGIFSALSIAPGTLFASFAEHGIDEVYTESVRKKLTSKLKALSDPTRMSILRMMRTNIDADNTQIAGWLHVSRPSVSMHAKILADAGLISTTHNGRQARHVFHPDEVRELCDELLRYLDVSGDLPGEEPRATDRSAG